MNKSAIVPMPEFFDRYINLVQEDNLLKALEQSLAGQNNHPWDQLEALGDKVYAPGKWTIKDIVQHMIDTERIITYRALRFSRNDATVLAGFEEDHYAANADAQHRTLSDLRQELTLLRQASLALFQSFTPDMFQRRGVAFKSEISVLALGFVVVGHEMHHWNVIRERYLSL
jgi:uncharacterized damage-inducible protein DinB